MTRKTDTWIFNIQPDNWDQCVNGPEDATVHGEENVGVPVQAVPEGATAPIMTSSRVTSHWHESKAVESQGSGRFRKSFP